MGDAHRRYTDDPREMGLGKAMFFKDFAKELTSVNRRQTVLDHENLRSMAIGDLNVESVALREAKAHSPLVIDSDAPLAFAITLKSLQTIRWRGLEIFNPSCRVELRKPHRGSTANLRGQAPGEHCRIEPLGLRISEGLNHSSEHKHFVYVCQAPYLRPRAPSQVGRQRRVKRPPADSVRFFRSLSPTVRLNAWLGDTAITCRAL